MLLDHHSPFFLRFLAFSDPWSNAPDFFDLNNGQ